MENVRPITITVTSIAFIVFGVVTVAFAVILGVALSLSAGASEVVGLVWAIVGGLVFLMIVLGVLDIVAGYGLWHMKRWAAIMGMLLGIFGLIFQSFFYYNLVLGATYTYPSSIGYAGVESPWVDIILVFLIAISWKSFERSTVQTMQSQSPPHPPHQSDALV